MEKCRVVVPIAIGRGGLEAVSKFRRDARVVEWGGLENRCPGNWTKGSNPFLSAKLK
jgi:hypothetical protein